MCFCFTSNENCHFVLGKNGDSAKRVVDFSAGKRHIPKNYGNRRGFHQKKSYNKNGKPWKSLRIFRVKTKLKNLWRFRIFSFLRGYQRGLASLCCVTLQCGRATRPSHCVGTGVPWMSLPGPTSVPSDAQAGWHRLLCLCCVVVARAFDSLELWSCEYGC